MMINRTQTRRDRSRKLQRSLRVESLSKRELMAADIALADDGLLAIDGTEGSDQIVIRYLNSTTLEATVSNADGKLSKSFARAEVNGLVISGFDGNDVITNDTNFASLIDGGAGDDIIHGGDSTDLIFGAIGNDTIFGHKGDDQIDGGANDDHIEGGDDDDTIFGASGDDQLYGNDGIDRILGGLGDDHIWGGSGSDTLRGGEGNDILEGNSGRDNLLGGAGDDYLYGNDDRDTLDGGEGIDHVYGGDGRDVLLRGDGLDFLTGGSGDDDWINGSFLIDSVESDFEDGWEVMSGKHEFTWQEFQLDDEGTITLVHAESDNYVHDDSVRIGGEVTFLEYTGSPKPDSPAGRLLFVVTGAKIGAHAQGDTHGNIDVGAEATKGQLDGEITGEAGRVRFGISAGQGAGFRTHNDENGIGFGLDYKIVSFDLQLTEEAATEWAEKVDWAFSTGWSSTKHGAASSWGWVGKKTGLW